MELLNNLINNHTIRVIILLIEAIGAIIAIYNYENIKTTIGITLLLVATLITFLNIPIIEPEQPFKIIEENNLNTHTNEGYGIMVDPETKVEYIIKRSRDSKMITPRYNACNGILNL